MLRQLPGDTAQGGAGLHLDGALTIHKRSGSGDTRKTEYTLTATDVDFLAGDDYDFHGLVLTLFDLANGRERARLTSPLTRMRLPVVEGRPMLAEDERARFSNVALVLLEGAPVAPLTLRMPLLEWTPVTTSCARRIGCSTTGDGLSAEGSGMRLRRSASTCGSCATVRSSSSTWSVARA